jgi:peptidoglycan hydrolase CwlO-like protein
VLYGSIGTLIILLLWIWIVAILILAGNDLNSGIRRKADKLSCSEDANRRREIVIEDLLKHIKAYQSANETRLQKIETIQKNIEEQNVLIQNLEEEVRNKEMIIKAYEEYVEQERKRSNEQYSIADKVNNGKL